MKSQRWSKVVIAGFVAVALSGATPQDATAQCCEGPHDNPESFPTTRPTNAPTNQPTNQPEAERPDPRDGSVVEAGDIDVTGGIVAVPAGGDANVGFTPNNNGDFSFRFFNVLIQTVGFTSGGDTASGQVSSATAKLAMNCTSRAGSFDAVLTSYDGTTASFDFPSGGAILPSRGSLACNVNIGEVQLAQGPSDSNSMMAMNGPLGGASIMLLFGAVVMGGSGRPRRWIGTTALIAIFGIMLLKGACGGSGGNGAPGTGDVVLADIKLSSGGAVESAKGLPLTIANLVIE